MAPIIFKQTITTPSIVSSGLILNLDAGNVSSYSGSGTAWNDLSGNGNHGTLNSNQYHFPVAYSSSQGGYFTFDGPTYNQNFSINSAGSFNYGVGDFAIEIWAYPTTAAVNAYDPTIFTNKGNGDWDGYMRLQYGILLITGDVGNWINFSSSIQLNTWQQIVISRVSGVVTVYKNTTSIGTKTIGVAIGADGNRPALCISDSLPNGREHMSGRISIFRIYKNKGLTSTEVTQNFNAVKSRYGL